jgi:hypothetical protein
MASKTQRAAVRSRADKVHANIGSFIPRHAIARNPSSRAMAAAIVAEYATSKPPPAAPIVITAEDGNVAVFENAGEPFQIEVSTDPNHDFIKPLSADPDLYMATMATETPIQRDMVLDMLHNLSPDAEGNVAYSPYANDVLDEVLTHKSE